MNEALPEFKKELGTVADRYASGAPQSKNVRIHKRRTSIRLEPKMWEALQEIARMEGCTIHDLCGAVHDLKEPGASFSAALRVFMIEYYRSARAATETNNHVVEVQNKVRVNSGSFKQHAPSQGISGAGGF